MDRAYRAAGGLPEGNSVGILLANRRELNDVRFERDVPDVRKRFRVRPVDGEVDRGLGVVSPGGIDRLRPEIDVRLL